MIVKGVVKKKIQSPGIDFYLSKYYHLLRMYISMSRTKRPIVVYQMGKVGSRSVVNSLKLSGLDRPVYHVHYITKTGLNYYWKMTRSAHRQRPGKHYWNGHFLRNELEKRRGEWDVISLVRDPVARNVSAFFHDILNWFPDFSVSDFVSNPIEYVNLLQERFLDSYPPQLPLTWFDDEFKKALGLDVYMWRFPKKQGYYIYPLSNSNSNIRLLVLRLEDLDRVAEKAFAEFLGVETIRMVRANVSDYRDYAQVYRVFLTHCRFPKEYLMPIYESKFVKHFYTDEEIDRFYRKWSGGDLP